MHQEGSPNKFMRSHDLILQFGNHRLPKLIVLFARGVKDITNRLNGFQDGERGLNVERTNTEEQQRDQSTQF